MPAVQQHRDVVVDVQENHRPAGGGRSQLNPAQPAVALLPGKLSVCEGHLFLRTSQSVSKSSTSLE